MKIILMLIVSVILSLFHAVAGEIALSFDDAPTQGNSFMSGMDKTRGIIEGLKSNNVKDAVFFVTTGNIVDDKGKERIEAYTQAGFHLANHSHNHLSANKVDVKKYLADFNKSHLVLQDYKNVLKLHRFPYLHYGSTTDVRKKLEKHLSGMGYKFGYVTVDNFDWYINGRLLSAHHNKRIIDFNKLRQLYVETIWQSIHFYDQLAKSHVGKPVKHILLLHENELAALFIGDLVSHIRSQGWKVISPIEAYKDEILNVYTPEFSFNKQGRVAAIAHQKGIAKTKLRHESENAKFLDKKLEENGIFK
ncbi:polysaccharide deacetylase family protein [Pseudoalteromonas sp. MMG005]|uniref:polysaccharide deacetylase family protein n=1 Tax=Pseudoalteromonas sp. MMG005 TaxID=2822682 RepID=UPI001B3A19E2|nr:polysaccharide deacetylase family protein [Pseudoalteromonas sp. MMG005]